MMSRAWMVAVVLGLTFGQGWAKLPPPSEEAKAKAEEAKAKAAETAKMDAEALGKYQDQVAERYICLLYTSPSPRDGLLSRMPSSA